MAQLLNFAKFGLGKDGSPAVSGVINTYASATGSAGSKTLTTGLSASLGDIIMIHQTQGSGVGQWEINYVISDNGSTLTLLNDLAYTYGTGAQAVLVKQYEGGTLSGAVTGNAWDGSTGGIITLMCRGSLNVSGSISANAIGFRGSSARASGVDRSGGRGECTTGFDDSTESSSNNVNGGGGGVNGASVGGGGGGGGGGNSASGNTGETSAQSRLGGTGGSAVGNAALTTSILGGGGGSGGQDDNSVGSTGAGGKGGGLIFIFAKTITGNITANGQNGVNSNTNGHGGGGGGAGGSILIKCRTATLGTNTVTSSGGSGGALNGSSGAGGAGSAGRIHIDYVIAPTGTTTPTLDSAQDLTLRDLRAGVGILSSLLSN